MLEIAATLGRVLPQSNDERAAKFLSDFRILDGLKSPEIEIAFARIGAVSYSKHSDAIKFDDWQSISSVIQGSSEAFTIISDTGYKMNEDMISKNRQLLQTFLEIDSLQQTHPTTFAIPDLIRSYAALKPNDLTQVLIKILTAKDTTIRATVAELLGSQVANAENVEALKLAFNKSLATDKHENDAQLAILSALVKLNKNEAVNSLKVALDAPDYLVRRHAAQLIKQNDLTKEFPNLDAKVGTVKPQNPASGTKLGQVLNTEADYRRAVSRKNGQAKAIVTTEKGAFTIEFFPEDAPLAVDNFIRLAKSNYFNNVAIHRVVPNFVVQDGDPRGDGNGSPGWQIRCEINQIPYERGAVGMALSGKDTGGSQWFVTHSPQPHLDGGYTVFGRVNETDMKIVDNLARGDKIIQVKIVEGNVSRKGR
jgi:cyclophilin family peptidyl-prolyl cis-trans isomerase